MKPLTYDQSIDLQRLLISRGVPVTVKASTVSMDIVNKETKIIRETGWVAVAEETPEVKALLEEFAKGLV